MNARWVPRCLAKQYKNICFEVLLPRPQQFKVEAGHGTHNDRRWDMGAAFHSSQNTSWNSVKESKFYESGNNKSVSVCWKIYGNCIMGCRYQLRWTHTIDVNAYRDTGGYSLEETWTSVARYKTFTTAMQLNTAHVSYRSCCSRFTGTFLTRHPKVLTLTSWLSFVRAAEATPVASPIPL